MTLKDLLKKGYFPKELPPPFNTKALADNLSKIQKEWTRKQAQLSRDQKEKFRDSKCTVHSLPKVGYSRRILSLPNPYHQILLSKTITDNWIEIENIYAKSNSTRSKPIKDKKGSRAAIHSHNFNQFKTDCIINSFDKLYELRTDISRYYPTVYTHIIPWIIHTKVVAKEKRNDYSLLGNALDRDLRNCNSGQTIGIPIGPDTSLIVAEIIGCTLDELIEKKFKTIKSFRYYDDFYIYCESQSTAEKVFKYIQGLFTEYQLDINEEKTTITKSPHPFESEWAIALGSFIFREGKISQQTDLERFISLSFKYQLENPKDSVLKFAVSCLKTIPILKSSWKLFQSLLLKIAITEPVTLPDITQILISTQHKVDKSKVKSVAEFIINEHTPKGHHFEVSWALWLCKEFQIKLPNNIAELVLNSNDVCSILIALDLRSINKINKSVSTKSIKTDLTTESLMSENWLLTYEALTKGWIKTKKDIVGKNEFFELLKKNNISFYDQSSKIKKIESKSPKSKGVPISQLKTQILGSKTNKKEIKAKTKKPELY